MVIFEQIIQGIMFKYFSTTLIWLILVIFSKSTHAQTGKDTIRLLNGAVVVATVIDTLNGVTTIKNQKDSTKNDIIENDRIFSISNENGESIMYVYDTILGNEFTIEEMRYFMVGEQDAEMGFKARGAFWGNLVLGAAGAVTGSFLCPLPVFAFSAASGLPRVNVKHNTVSKIDYIKHDTYIMGYERVARKKRKISSLIGGGAGIVAGLGGFFILRATDNEIQFK